MNKTKNHWDQLSKSVISFQKLNEKHGRETEYMKKLYRSIREQCLVKVYMDTRIRKLISEEEMSGFIIYLEERLRPIILGFIPKNTSFEIFFMKVASYRALNYLSKKARKEKMDFALSKFVFLEDQAKEFDDDCFPFTDKQQSPKNARAVNILRHICTKRTSFQKRIFIYMISFVLYLKAETVEKICEDFNMNIEETFAISNKILQEITDKSSKKKVKFLEMRNKNWSYLLYTQLELEQVCEENRFALLQEKEQRYIDKNTLVNQKLDMLRKRTNYSLLSKVLKLPSGTISSTIYLVKNVLKAIETEEFENVLYERKLASFIQAPKEVEELPPFSPFEAFGINGIWELQEEQ